MKIEEASNYFRLIADPNRLTILKVLTTNLHMSANEFLKYVSCKQATLSHHLNEMSDAGLLNSKKKGNKVFYSLNAPVYEQLTNYLNKIDRVKRNDNPIRVVDTPLIDGKKEKEELPTFLL